MGFSPIPSEIKPVAHLMKLADEHENRNIVVAYWARMAACRLALKLTPGGRSAETGKLIKELLDWLEATKTENKDNEGITNETAAQAIIEEYALRLFEHGDQQDRAEIFNKNTIKTFYTSGMLIDVLDQFEISEDLREKQRYAKWKAAFIHNCLKAGERPYPGPPKENEEQNNTIVKVSDLPEEERERLVAEHRERERQKREEEERNRLRGEDGVPGLPNVPSYNPINGGSGNGESSTSPTTPFVPQQPGHVTPAAPSTPAPQPTAYRVPSADNGTEVTLSPDQIQKAQKYSKYATSALNYDDVKTAIENLQKALNMLQLGKE